MMKRLYFFTIGYLYAVVFGFVQMWRGEREAYRRERELKKILNTPHYRAERKIDKFLYELEHRQDA